MSTCHCAFIFMFHHLGCVFSCVWVHNDGYHGTKGQNADAYSLQPSSKEPDENGVTYLAFASHSAALRAFCTTPSPRLYITANCATQQCGRRYNDVTATGDALTVVSCDIRVWTNIDTAVVKFPITGCFHVLKCFFLVLQSRWWQSHHKQINTHKCCLPRQQPSPRPLPLRHMHECTRTCSTPAAVLPRRYLTTVWRVALAILPPD